jgi:hypothetical protein
MMTIIVFVFQYVTQFFQEKPLAGNGLAEGRANGLAKTAQICFV